MNKDEFLKWFAEVPDLQWQKIEPHVLDRSARELFAFNNPVQQHLDRLNESITDSELLRNGTNSLAVQLTIVLQKQQVKVAERDPFSARVRAAKQLTSPALSPDLITMLETINKLYVMTHDVTLVSFSQNEWHELIPQLLPAGHPNLRMRVTLAMCGCAALLDQLGGNTRE